MLKLALLPVVAIALELPQGIIYELSPEKLAGYGFTQYYNRTFSEYWAIRYLKPPANAKELYLGCRGVNETNIQIGMFGEADFIFTQKYLFFYQTQF